MTEIKLEMVNDPIIFMQKILDAFNAEQDFEKRRDYAYFFAINIEFFLKRYFKNPVKIKCQYHEKYNLFNVDTCQECLAKMQNYIYDLENCIENRNAEILLLKKELKDNAKQKCTKCYGSGIIGNQYLCRDCVQFKDGK